MELMKRLNKAFENKTDNLINEIDKLLNQITDDPAKMNELLSNSEDIVKALHESVSSKKTTEQKIEFSLSFLDTVIAHNNLLELQQKLNIENIKRNNSLIKECKSDPLAFFEKNGPVNFPFSDEFINLQIQVEAAKKSLQKADSAFIGKQL